MAHDASLGHRALATRAGSSGASSVISSVITRLTASLPQAHRLHRARALDGDGRVGEEAMQRMTREEYERGRNGGYEMESETPSRRHEDEMRYGPMRRGGRGQHHDTVHHAQMVKVIEVLAESEHGWEDAAQNALDEAQRSLRNIRSIWVKDMQAIVRDGRIRLWRLNAKISFALEPDEHHQGYRGRD
jgi:flavin-binding protein dodecin